eukprot:XP_011677629.1 PREDICTED: 5-hydroxytryptamine receptor 1A-like [Strongylocentrotus purpuratus]
MGQGSSLHSLSVDFGDTSGTFGTSDLDLSTSDMTPRAQKKVDSTRPRGAKVKRDKQTQLAIKWAKLSADKQVAVAGSMVVLTTVICWAPYALVHACFLDFTPSHMLGVATMWLGYTNAMLDPLIYAFFNRQIRSKIIGHFNACFSCLN